MCNFTIINVKMLEVQVHIHVVIRKICIIECPIHVLNYIMMGSEIITMLHNSDIVYNV